MTDKKPRIRYVNSCKKMTKTLSFSNCVKILIMLSRYLRREQSASQLLFATLLSLAHRKFLFTCLDFKPASCIRRQEHEFIVKAQTDEGHTLHGRRDPHNRVLCQGTIHFVIALKNHLQFQIGNFQLHPTWLYFKGFEKETVPLEEGLLFHKVISNP